MSDHTPLNRDVSGLRPEADATTYLIRYLRTDGTTAARWWVDARGRASFAYAGGMMWLQPAEDGARFAAAWTALRGAA